MVPVQLSETSETAKVRSRLEVALHPRYWSLLQGIGTCLAVWGVTLLLLATARSESAGTDRSTIESLALLFLVWSVAVPMYWLFDVILGRIERVLMRDQAEE